MATDHPLLDGTAGHYAWTETLADRVYYSEGLTSFFAWVLHRGQRPVLVTYPDGRLTFPLLYQLENIGGLWLRKEDDHYRDLRSGAVYPSVGDVPDDAQGVGQPAPGLDLGQTWVTFSVSVQHPAEASTMLGELVEIMWRELTRTDPAGWGLHEPCLSPWDRAAYTASARRMMPYCNLVVSGGFRAPVQAMGLIRRNQFGVEEGISGVAVLPPGTDMNAVGGRAVESLRGVADALPVPSVGVVGVSRGGPEVRFAAPLVPTLMPLAVLVGPRAMRALGVDARGFVATYGGLTAGRSRFPSVVVPLFGTGAGVWERLRHLVGTFSVDRLADALYLPRPDGDGHAA